MTFVVSSVYASISLALGFPEIGVLVAGVAMGVGLWAFFACPQRPLPLKLLALVLVALNSCIGLAHAVGYLSHMSPSFRIWTMSFSRAFTQW
jgi:hypothetical protein